MNKKFLVAAFLTVSASLYAQNIYQLEDYSTNDLNGTARYVGMGGAMNALGADISVMSSNPAGIGLYRRSDVAGTLSVVSQADAKKFDNKSGSHMSFDQLGLVYCLNVGNSTTKFVNFGLNYRKHKDFNKLINTGMEFASASGGPSQTWQMHDIGFLWGVSEENNTFKFDPTKGTPLSNMGYETYLYDVDPNDVLNGSVYNASANDYRQAKWGSIQDYSLSLGFNFSEQWYLGFALGVYNVDYNSYSEYGEYLLGINNNTVYDAGNYTLTNRFDISGTGVDFKAGLIVRPVEDNPFRIGFSFTTPTYYSLRSRKSATLYAYIQDPVPYYGYDLDYEYNLYTPWKFNVSLGTTFFNQLAIGAEYEYSDYSASKITYDTGYDAWGDRDSERDDAIKSESEKYLKGVSTFKIGAEWYVDPKLCIRFGYNDVTSPMSKNAFYNQFINSMSLDCATTTAYMNPSAINRFTVGMGTNLGNFYADLACMFQNQHADFYAAYPTETYNVTPNGVVNEPNALPATRLKFNQTKVMLTLGYRF